MKRFIIINVLVSILLLSCNKKNSEIILPTIAPITEAIFAPGHIEAVNQFTLTAVNDGYITEVLSHEGDIVSSNQIILKQDNASAVIIQRATSENLEITQKQASSNSAALLQLKAQLSSAEAKMQNAKQQLDRIQQLYAKQIIAKVDLENAQLTYNSSFYETDAIKKNIESTKLNLKQSLIGSKKEQQTAVVNTNYFTIKSPGTYKVYSILKKKGEFVRKGEAIGVLGDAISLKTILNIDELSISKVKVGQIVLVELNTEKGKTYEALVSKIYPSYDESSQSYKVEASFRYPENKIINGTFLQANIIVAKKSNALLIPRSSLSPDNKIILITNKENDTIEVQTGIIAADWVEIRKGIRADNRIIKNF